MKFWLILVLIAIFFWQAPWAQSNDGAIVSVNKFQQVVYVSANPGSLDKFSMSGADLMVQHCNYMGRMSPPMCFDKTKARNEDIARWRNRLNSM